MYKKLTSKTQLLNATLPDNVAGFSKAFLIEPETDDALLRRGKVFVVFDANGGSGYDVNLVTKVVHDVLHDSYFQSENISPTQSLEKAISDVKEKIAHLTNESIKIDEPPVEFSIVAGVLWGNVMYVVQYGVAQSYLIREAEIKPINAISEGSFSAASGVVKDGDVIIFCSQEFGKKYPPNKLLSLSITEQELLPREACILSKFIVDTSFSPNETVDFGLTELPRKKESSKIFKKFAALFFKFRLPKIKKAKTESVGIKLRRQGGFNFKKLLTPTTLVILLVIALWLSILWTMKNKKPTTTVDKNSPQEQIPTPVVEGAKTTAPISNNEGVFYDIKISDSSATPQNIAVFDSTVVVTDPTNGKVYLSDLETAKFDPVSDTFAGIKNLVNIKGKLGFTDTQGYKVYDFASKKITEDYKKSDLGVTSAYLDFIYSIIGNTLNRYSKVDGTLKESLWGQSDDFTDAKSLAVAYNIYVITKAGDVESFTGGAKTNFKLSGENSALNNPTQIIADIDFNNIYVADTGNKRVVSFDDKGNFVKEYKSTGSEWNDIKSIGVSPNEKTLFVLNGSKVYKVTL